MGHSFGRGLVGAQGLWLGPWSPLSGQARVAGAQGMIQVGLCAPPPQGCSPTSVCEEEDDKQKDAQTPEPCTGPNGNASTHLHRLVQRHP